MRCSEKEVVEIWRLLSSRELVSEDGEVLRVIYPGRPNDDRGADFRDAVIATRRGLIKGDIEVHTRASDWWAHGHHRDPLYDRVVLHVVMWNDGVKTEHKRGVPVLALEKYIKRGVGISDVESIYGGGSVWCSAAVHVPPDILTGFLEDAGKRRFMDKAARFQAELATIDAGQCLYRGIMGALGYAKNKLPFMELADRVPLQLLESISRSGMAEDECIIQMQTLLLGTAGLLLSQRSEKQDRSDELIEKLEKVWSFMRQREVMTHDRWNLFKVRPGNFPVRRIAATSCLIWRYREVGLFSALLNMVRCARKDCDGDLKRGLMVSGDDYWAKHFDLGLSVRKIERALIGGERADNIAVNIVLPFVFAWSGVNGEPEFGEKAFELYSNYPLLATNSIEKHMREQLDVGSRVVNSACRQQGLIHIYKNLCTQGKCGECRLSQLQPGNSVKV